METTLLTTGLACVIAAIAGGGLKALGFEIPALASVHRQVGLGAFGALLLVIFAAGKLKPPVPRPIPPGPDTSFRALAYTDSSAQRAYLISKLSDAYAYSGRLAIFLDGWMRPPGIETARIADGTLSFTGRQGIVSTSIDTSLMPAITMDPDFVNRAKLTSTQASHVASFLTAYDQLKAALYVSRSATSGTIRGSLLDATSTAQEAARRGFRALCSLSDSLPTLERAFPPKQDARSPCPVGKVTLNDNDDFHVRLSESRVAIR